MSSECGRNRPAPVLENTRYPAPKMVPANDNEGIASLVFSRPQADTDGRLIELFLHGRNRLTVAAYSADLESFMRFVDKPLQWVTIADLQAWLDQLDGSPATRARRLAAVKSLLTFATKIGYVPFNVGAPVRSPVVVRVLAERILSEEDVVRLLALERDPRNHALIRLLYLAALRVSEACRLRWRDCKARKAGGQISVIGKRSKVRAILLPVSMWRELAALKPAGAAPEDPVFRSRQGDRRPIDASQAERIVKAAAVRAGLPRQVSPHWLRHAHCSHALDRGANPALVRDTAGHADLKVTSIYSHARPDQSSSLFLVA